MFDFIPDDKSEEGVAFEIPAYEDARADIAPYYRSQKSVEAAKTEVVEVFVQLGASNVNFRPGRFVVDKMERYGYVITFQLGRAPGFIRVAGLPIRVQKGKDGKIEKVRVQALLNVRDWLKASVTGRVFSPGSHPLLQHVLVDGTETVTDYIMSNRPLPPALVSEIQ